MFTAIFNKIFDQLLLFTFIKTVKTDFVRVKTLKIIFYQSNEPWLVENFKIKIHGTYVVNIFPIKLVVEFKFRIRPLFPRIVYRLSLYYWNVKCICSVVFGRFQICCHFLGSKLIEDSFGPPRMTHPDCRFWWMRFRFEPILRMSPFRLYFVDIDHRVIVYIFWVYVFHLADCRLVQNFDLRVRMYIFAKYGK